MCDGNTRRGAETSSLFSHPMNASLNCRCTTVSHPLILLTALTGLVQHLAAETYVDPGVTATQSWASTALWFEGTIPDGIGATADITADIPTVRSINLNGNRTLGTLIMGDPGVTYAPYTIGRAAGDSTSALIFNNGGTGASITVSTTSAVATSGPPAGSNFINASVILQDNLTLNVDANNGTPGVMPANPFTGLVMQNFPISGNYGITKNGTYGVVAFGANTYTGGTVINGGRITGGAVTSFGTGSVTVNSGGQAYIAATGTVANNFTINGNGYAETTGVLGALRLNGGNTLTGSITVASASRLETYASTTANNLNGLLLGSANLEINAATASGSGVVTNHNGTFNFNGSGAGYTGTLTISRGTSVFGSGFNPGGSVVVGDVATLAGETNIAGNLTLGSAGGGAGAGSTYLMDGSTAGALSTAGNLTLSKLNTIIPISPAAGSNRVFNYSGSLSGTAANLALAPGTYRAGTGFDVGTAGQVNLTVVQSDLTWNGGTGTWNKAGTNWVGGVNYFDLDNVTFDDTNAGAKTVTVTGTHLVDSMVINNTAGNDYTFTTSANNVITGGSVTKNGTGTATFGGVANTWLGGTTLNNGRIRVAVNNALGATTSPITINGGAISSDGTTARSVANPLVLNAGYTHGDATNNGALTISGATTLANSITIDVQGTSANAHALSGNITETGGSRSITKTGATSSLTLSGTNSYTGGTFINSGRINAQNASPLGTGAVTVSSSGQLYLGNAAANITNAVTLAGTGYNETTGFLGALRMTGNTLSNSITIAAGGANITAYSSTGTLGGVIGGPGKITYGYTGGTGTATAGTITVSGNNIYGGGTDVTNALIVAGHNNAFGTGGVAITRDAGKTAAGHTARITLANGVNVGNALDIGAPVGVVGRGALEVAGTDTATWSGPITISGTPTAGGHFYTPATATLNLTGSITSAGTPVSQRDGNVTYSGGGSYSSLLITGTGRVGANNGISTTATVDLAPSGSGLLDLNGRNQTLAGLVRTHATNSAIVSNTALATASILTINSAGDTVFPGSIQDGGPAGGTIGLTKTGSAVFTLSGDSIYSGATLVQQGTLKVNGTIQNSAVTVAASGTLGGTGSILSTTQINGIHSPGSSPGIQTFGGGLTYSASSSLTWELDTNATAVRGTNFDGVDVTGGAFSLDSAAVINLSLGGTVDFTDTFWATTQSWLVVDLGTGVTGDGGSTTFAVGAITGGANYSAALGTFSTLRTADGAGKNDVYLAWTPVPEPSAALLAALSSSFLLLRRRKA